LRRGTGEEEGGYYERSLTKAMDRRRGLLIESMTDNRIALCRDSPRVFQKRPAPCRARPVAWMFEKKGYIVVPEERKSQKKNFLRSSPMPGAEDLRTMKTNFEIITAPGDLIPCSKL